MLGAQQANGARQTLGAAGARKLAEIKMPVADLRRFGGDNEVASEQQLKPASHANAVDGGDIDLGRGLDGIQGVEKILQESLELVGVSIEIDVAVEIAAGREAAAPPGNNDSIDVGLWPRSRRPRPSVLSPSPNPGIELLHAQASAGPRARSSSPLYWEPLPSKMRLIPQTLANRPTVRLSDSFK